MGSFKHDVLNVPFIMYVSVKRTQTNKREGFYGKFQSRTNVVSQLNSESQLLTKVEGQKTLTFVCIKYCLSKL